MPAPTDHRVRRLEVARAAVHSIAKTGLEGATIRAVADEGGWSVGVVQYYFRSKSELLIAAVDFLAEQTSQTMSTHAGTDDVMTVLTRVFNQIVFGRGRNGANYWKVWICFWAQATNDSQLAEAVDMRARLWRQKLTSVLLEGQADGSIRPDVDPESEAAYLAAVIQGLGISSVVENSYPLGQDMIERMVSRLATPVSKLTGTVR